MTTKQTGTTARDPRPPSALVRRPEDDARSEAERLRAAVAALDRVRTQLARTQNTLDAFVAQITGTPDGSHMRTPLPPAPAPLPDPAPARTPATAPDASRFDPPDVLVGHLRPPAELQPPPAPPVHHAPVARTVPAAPTTPAPPRPAPPGPLSGHVTRPGERPPASGSTPFVDPAVSTAAVEAPTTSPAAPTPIAPATPGGADAPADAPAPAGDASSRPAGGCA
ncbi:MAG: hypothetical protein F2817_06620, partial [Actinobacteria bacterium]|nr:hypothetical protein [Actinomycetota bacterium]